MLARSIVKSRQRQQLDQRLNRRRKALIREAENRKRERAHEARNDAHVNFVRSVPARSQ